MINQKLRNAVKLSDKKSYEIAHKAGLHPSTLSRVICGIEKVKPSDPRVVAIRKVLGFSENECFEKVIKNSGMNKSALAKIRPRMPTQWVSRLFYCFNLFNGGFLMNGNNFLKLDEMAKVLKVPKSCCIPMAPTKSYCFLDSYKTGVNE